MRTLFVAALGFLVIVGGAGSGKAQIGGAGVTKAIPATLGYVQFVTPPPSANALSNPSLCRGWPFPSFTQATGLVGGYAVINDGSGHPHYLAGC